jgi:DNA-binding transcriptional LysR family regulator
MELRLIETFVEAARRQSFSAAARALQISPAAVSQNVRSLEDRLGARLFTRTTRSVRLTPEGQRYFLRIEPAMQALGSAADALAEERDEMQGWVRISSTTAFGRSEVIPLLDGYMREHPRVRVDLSLSDQFVDLVSEGFDFAVRGGVLPVNDYVSRQLLPVTPLVVASPAYAQAVGLPQRIEDIAQHRCVAMRSNPTQKVFAWEFKRGKLPIQVEIDACCIVNDPQGAALAAAAGIGLAQVGSNVVLPMIREGTLVSALAQHASASRGIYAVYPSRRYLPKRVSRLIEFMASRLAERADLVPHSLGDPGRAAAST